MGIILYLDAVKGECGATRSLIPALRAGGDKELLYWFDRHNCYGEDLLSPGPWYEYQPEDIDELIKDCKDAVSGNGWFIDNPPDKYHGNQSIDADGYQAVVDILEKFKKKQGEDWDNLFFLYSFV